MFGLFGGGAPKISVGEVKDGMAKGTVVLVDLRDQMERKRCLVCTPFSA
ncbi:hypothetical protein [Celeribacter sp.]